MYKVEYKVKNTFDACSISDVKLSGRIGEKLDKVIYERFTSEYAQKEVFAEAERAFVDCVDDEKAPIGIWQGEFWGKQMISACRAYRYTGNEQLLSFISESCYRIIAHQKENGYLGTYKNEKQIFHTSCLIGRKIMGWDCEWTWNIWCRKYTLWALVEAYTVTRDESFLSAARKSADHLISMLSEMEAKICETGMFYGQASGSILKPMLLLYRLCGDKKYLDFSLDIASQWEDDDTCCTKLISSALSGIPIHDWGYVPMDIPPKSRYNPLVEEGKPVFDMSTTNPEKSNKVYEMQSCFDGILELYRVTGEEKYFKAAKCFFDLMLRDEYNTLCSVGFNDIFINAAKYQSSVSELCDVIHFMRLATELYALCGDVKYMDITELAFYNCYLAGVTRDGKWGARIVRGADGHHYARLQAGFTKNHCCVNNMVRGFINIAEYAVVTSGDTLCLNFYLEGKLSAKLNDGGRVSLEIGEGYVSRQRVTVKINAELKGDRTLRLRIPSWSRYTVITYCGKASVLNKAPCYYDITLENGESILEIAFDPTPRLVKGNYKLDFFPITPYMLQRYKSGEDISEDTVIYENHATLFVGPTLLALSKDLGCSDEDITKKRSLCEKSFKVTLTPVGNPNFACAYSVSLTSSDGESYTLPMGDFTSASDTMEYMPKRYTVYI